MKKFSFLVLMPWNNGSNVKETKVHKIASFDDVLNLLKDRIQWYYYHQVPVNVVLENKDLINIEIIKPCGVGMNCMNTDSLLKKAYDKVEWRGDKL